MRVALLVLGLGACSVLPVSAVVRSPVDSKCQSFGLKGCPELVEGSIAYIEGNKGLALQKLDAARARNTPEQLAQFAGALRDVASMSEAARPLAEVAAILAKGAPAQNAAPGPRQPSPPAVAPTTASTTAEAPTERAQPSDDRRANAQRYALYALTAREDPARRVAETIELGDTQGAPCRVAGSEALCRRAKLGPIMVTDLVASEDCGQRVFLAAADSDTAAFGFLWTLPARIQGVHGAAFSVQGGQWLFVAVKAAKPAATDRGCFLTWSGFQPRLVPALAADPDDYTTNPYRL